MVFTDEFEREGLNLEVARKFPRGRITPAGGAKRKRKARAEGSESEGSDGEGGPPRLCLGACGTVVFALFGGDGREPPQCARLKAGAFYRARLPTAHFFRLPGLLAFFTRTRASAVATLAPAAAGPSSPFFAPASFTITNGRFLLTVPRCLHRRVPGLYAGRPGKRKFSGARPPKGGPPAPVSVFEVDLAAAAAKGGLDEEIAGVVPGGATGAWWVEVCVPYQPGGGVPLPGGAAVWDAVTPSVHEAGVVCPFRVGSSLLRASPEARRSVFEWIGVAAGLVQLGCSPSALSARGVDGFPGLQAGRAAARLVVVKGLFAAETVCADLRDARASSPAGAIVALEAAAPAGSCAPWDPVRHAASAVPPLPLGAAERLLCAAADDDDDDDDNGWVIHEKITATGDGDL
ncbi:hypothetical protein DIPPA_20365 [Diplonema papillatum]|nr:hypothetical protein DIPPA_20365 [Diplonema papillatum]